MIHICLFADRDVGKKTLAGSERLSRGFESNYIESIGVDFLYKKVELTEKKITLVFCINSDDEERFRHIWNWSIQRAHGVILMYDISNIKTLNRTSEWCVMVRNYRDDMPILLVGNKSDLEEHREVLNEILERFKQDNDISSSMEISIKTGENMENMFFNLACMVFNLDPKEILAEMLEEKREYFIWRIDRAIKKFRKKFESKRKLKKQEKLWKKYHFGKTKTFEEYVDHQEKQIIAFVDVKKEIMNAQELSEMLKVWEQVENFLNS